MNRTWQQRFYTGSWTGLYGYRVKCNLAPASAALMLRL
jgi:hypothetical protein